MPPDKKTTRVGTVKHPIGLSVALNVDRDSRRFWGDVNGKRIEASTGEEAEALILAEITQSMDADWQPLIILEVRGDRHMSHDPGHFVGLFLARVYYADVPNRPRVDRLRQAPWAAKDNTERLRKSAPLGWHGDDSFAPPCRYYDYSGEPTFYFPYTEELWRAVEAINEGIGAFRVHLEEKLKAGASAEALRQIAIPLLKFLPME